MGRTWCSAIATGALLVTTAIGTAVFASAQMPQPKLTPEKIEMGTFYDGARLHIEGTAPQDVGVLIVIEGSERDEFFNRKGRVGPIWLNVDRIHIKHAPSVFLSFSSAALDSLLDRAEVEQYQLNETAIMDRIHILCRCKCSLTDKSQQSGARDTVPDPSYKKLLYVDFLQLKSLEGDYQQHPGTVSLKASTSATQYSLEFEWPKKIPPGNYRVTAYACRGHKLVAQSSTTIPLVEIGFPAEMAALASKFPWIYGGGAVLAALLAGFLTDLIVGRLRRQRKTREQSSSAEPDARPSSPEEPSADLHETETTHSR